MACISSFTICRREQNEGSVLLYCIRSPASRIDRLGALGAQASCLHVGKEMNVAEKKKIVVLGMMSRMPVAGVVWQTVHYLVGFQRLGYDVYYVEAHGATPHYFFDHAKDNAWVKAASFIDSVMKRFDLGDRWAYHALHGNGQYYGLSESKVKELYSSGALIINLHGGTIPLPEHSATGRLIYLETDP